MKKCGLYNAYRILTLFFHSKLKHMVTQNMKLRIIFGGRQTFFVFMAVGAVEVALLFSA